MLLNYRISSIETKNFSILSFSDITDNVTFGLKFSFEGDFSRNEINLFCNISYNHSHNNVEFLNLEMSSNFEIDENSWNEMLQDNGEELLLYKDIQVKFANILYGTARGVLLSKTENTPYNKFYLPPINLNDLVNEDILIKK